jgi:hypothetical protein
MERHTRAIGRPDTNGLKLSAANFTFLEEGVDSTSYVASSCVDLPVCNPRISGRKFEGILRDDWSVAQEVAVLSCLHAICKNLVQSEKRIRRILVNQSPNGCSNIRDILGFLHRINKLAIAIMSWFGALLIRIISNTMMCCTYQFDQDALFPEQGPLAYRMV